MCTKYDAVLMIVEECGTFVSFQSSKLASTTELPPLDGIGSSNLLVGKSSEPEKALKQPFPLRLW